MSDVNRPERQILQTRIRFALRRATGVVFDIDAMLRKPELRESRIRVWRDVGSDELSSLLDQLETEFQADGASDHDDEGHGISSSSQARGQTRLGADEQGRLGAQWRRLA
jgi:hypothetical protein